MRTREEIEAELEKLREEAKRFNTPFYHHDEAVVRFAIRKLEWVLGLEEKECQASKKRKCTYNHLY